MPSVPGHVSQSQINAMNKKAEEQMAADGVEMTPEEPENTSEEVIEAAPEEVVEESPEETYEEEPESDEEPVKKSASSKEENMRILRQRSEKAESERDQLAELLLKMNNKGANTPAPATVKEELEDLFMKNDDLAEGKDLNTVYKYIRSVEKKLEESEKRNYTSSTEMRINQDFPDYAEVASSTNLQRLEDENPELAETIMATKDPYKQKALAYKMMKTLGIHKSKAFSKEKERVRNNASKPKPSAAVSPQSSDSPLNYAAQFSNGMTEDQRKQLYADTIRLAKRS